MLEPSKKHAVVEALRPLTPRVVELTLRPEDPAGEKFLPGQHLWIDGEVESRPFSIASNPLEPHALRFCIKRMETDSVSDQLASLAPGARISYTGPSGTFVLREDAGLDLLFIAGGIGLAPLRAMILELIAKDRSGLVDLLCGARREEDLLYPDEFVALSGSRPAFSYHPCLSREEDRWTGLRGRVTAVLPALYRDLSGRAIYVCGSGEMIRDTIAAVEALGADPDRIYTEVGTARSIALREAGR